MTPPVFVVDTNVLVAGLLSRTMWREPLGEAASGPDPGDDHLWALLDAYSGSDPHRG